MARPSKDRQEKDGTTTKMLHRRFDSSCPLCFVWGVPWDGDDSSTWYRQHEDAERLWKEWDGKADWAVRVERLARTMPVVEFGLGRGLTLDEEVVKRHFAFHRIEQPMLTDSLDRASLVAEVENLNEVSKRIITAVYRQRLLSLKQVEELFYAYGHTPATAKRMARAHIENLVRRHFLYRFFPSTAMAKLRDAPSQFSKQIIILTGKNSVPWLERTYDVKVYRDHYTQMAKEVKPDTLIHDLRANGLVVAMNESLRRRDYLLEIPMSAKGLPLSLPPEQEYAQRIKLLEAREHGTTEPDILEALALEEIEAGKQAKRDKRLTIAQREEKHEKQRVVDLEELLHSKFDQEEEHRVTTTIQGFESLSVKTARALSSFVLDDELRNNKEILERFELLSHADTESGKAIKEVLDTYIKGTSNHEKIIANLNLDNWYSAKHLSLSFIDPVLKTWQELRADGFACLDLHRTKDFPGTQLPFFYEYDHGSRTYTEVKHQLLAYHMLAVSGAAGGRFPELDVKGYSVPVIMIFSSAHRMHGVHTAFRELSKERRIERGSPIFLVSEEDWLRDPWQSSIVHSAWDDFDKTFSFIDLLLRSSKPLIETQALSNKQTLTLDLSQAKRKFELTTNLGSTGTSKSSKKQLKKILEALPAKKQTTGPLAIEAVKTKEQREKEQQERAQQNKAEPVGLSPALIDIPITKTIDSSVTKEPKVSEPELSPILENDVLEPEEDEVFLPPVSIALPEDELDEEFDSLLEGFVSPGIEAVIDTEPVDLIEPIIEPVIEPIIEPVIEPIIEPIIEPVIEPIIEPIIEPVIEPMITPIVEPISESIAGIVIQPVESVHEEDELDDEEIEIPVLGFISPTPLIDDLDEDLDEEIELPPVDFDSIDEDFDEFGMLSSIDEEVEYEEDFDLPPPDFDTIDDLSEEEIELPPVDFDQIDEDFVDELDEDLELPPVDFKDPLEDDIDIDELPPRSL